MKIKLEIDNAELRKMIREKLLSYVLVDAEIEDHMIHIETKSKQNYRAEWENADIRAHLLVDTEFLK